MSYNSIGTAYIFSSNYQMALENYEKGTQSCSENIIK
jgi:hypothetical protein